MTPKKMLYTTLAGSALFVAAFVVGFPMYLEHRTYTTDHPVIKIQKPVTFNRALSALRIEQENT